MIAPVIANSQSFILPTSVLDSMLWEVERGRSCDSLRIAQVKLIQSQALELVSTGKELKLSQASNETLSSLLRNSRDSQEIQGLQFQKDLNSERRKTKRWRKIGIIEGVGLIGLLILIL